MSDTNRRWLLAKRPHGQVTESCFELVESPMADLTKWAAAGEIAYRVDVQEGIENVPKTFLRLFSGKNRGKQLLRLTDADEAS